MADLDPTAESLTTIEGQGVRFDSKLSYVIITLIFILKNILFSRGTKKKKLV